MSRVSPNEPRAGASLSLESVSLRRRTWLALLWSGIGSYGSSVLHLGALLALGWLLPPTDFGLLALALIFVGIAGSIGELGLSAALIQQKESGPTDLDSAFWCNLAIHLALALGTVAGAAPITSFLGDPRAAPLLQLLSLVFPISALAVVPRAILHRRMSFRPVSAAQLAGEVGFGAVGLTLGLLGLGAWSLAGAVLAQRAANSAVLWFAVDWRPGLAIDFDALRRLVRFGGPFMASAMVGRALIHVDYFVIGRFLGTEPLGYYSLAYQLAVVPLDRLVGLAGRVAFPAFSIVQESVERLKRGLLEGLRHLFTAVLPVVMAIVVLGPWLLRGLYGDKWEPSVVTLRILGLAGLCLLPRLAEAAFLALGKPHLRLWLALGRLAVFVALVAIGLRSGIEGIAACVAASLVAWAGATLAIAMRTLGIGAVELGESLWPAARAGLAALAPLLLFPVVSSTELSPWVALASTGVVMISIYLALALPPYRGVLRSWRRS